MIDRTAPSFPYHIVVQWYELRPIVVQSILQSMITTRVKNVLLITLKLHFPPPHIAPPAGVQGFVDEIVEIGQVKWLKDFYTSKDKKGIITKVKKATCWYRP